MKTLNTKTLSDGRRRVTVELEHNEDLHASVGNAFYKLGDPFGDIVSGHVISGMRPVYWCIVSQEWVDA